MSNLQLINNLQNGHDDARPARGVSCSHYHPYTLVLGLTHGFLNQFANHNFVIERNLLGCDEIAR